VHPSGPTSPLSPAHPYGDRGRTQMFRYLTGSP
jgi:hypothetical protein